VNSTSQSHLVLKSVQKLCLSESDI
jgi:hypothetical protein